MRFLPIYLHTKRKNHFIYNLLPCQEIIAGQAIWRFAVHGTHRGPFCRIFFVIFCNISGSRVIIAVIMVGVMAKTATRTNNDDLVRRARTDAEALGQLYDLHYDQIFRFCLCRLFSREAAEDMTSVVFLTVARGISSFKGRTRRDFRNWLYRIAVNHANSHIRKTSRRKQLFEEAARMMQSRRTDSTDHTLRLDWPILYAAILKLKPKHQTIIILRFFADFEFEQIAKIVKARPATVRVTLHRILKKLRTHLQSIMNGEV